MLTSPIAVAALFFVAAELAVRAAAPVLPEPVDWYSEAAQAKAEQMEALARRDRSVDVVFAGTSMMMLGLDAGAFRASDPHQRTQYNAALPAASTEVMRRWLIEEVVPRLRPRLVVYGLSSVDLNAGRPTRTIDLYEKARATRRGAMAEVDRFAARHCKLFFYRPVLRDPGSYEEALKRWRGEHTSRLDRFRSYFGPSGEWEERPPFDVTERERRRVRDEVLGRFTLGRSADALERTVAELRRAGIAVVLVDMPVPDRFIALHPRGEADYRAAREQLRRSAARRGVPLLDMASGLHDDALFSDYTHLSPEGAQVFSARLAAALAQAGPAPAAAPRVPSP